MALPGAAGSGHARLLLACCLAVALGAPVLASNFGAASLEALGANVASTLRNINLHAIADAARTFWDIVGPGGRLHPKWFLEHKGHLVIEGVLLVVILGLFTQRSSQPRSNGDDELTEKEVDALCRDWEPEPLVPKLTEEEWRPEPAIIEKRISAHRAVVGGKEVLNLASLDFLGLGDDEEVLAAARSTVARYGVGSCGPRGFYGTFDVHLDLEQQLAAFMGTQEAIIYSYDTATITSVIPAFASRPDLLVVDEACSFPIQQGCTLSRARLHTFKHNDVADLEALLIRLEKAEAKERKPLCRKMIVVEGVYANSGEVAPLAAIWALKERFKYRLCVEESHSFGVLGERGRGACEAAGLAPGQVEIIAATMGGALASVGGFCAGDHQVCDHQRLSGQGYCFSASLPPYLAAAAIKALAALGDAKRGPALAAKAREAAAALRAALGGAATIKGAKASTAPPGLKLVGGPNDAHSPLLHLQLAVPVPGSRGAADAALQRVADRLTQSHGILVSVARYTDGERRMPPPSMRLVVNASMDAAAVASVASAIRQAASAELGRYL